MDLALLQFKNPTYLLKNKKGNVILMESDAVLIKNGRKFFEICCVCEIWG